jgi:hypothetical protein
MVHAWLIAASALIILLLGALHLLLTYRGNKFWPRDTGLKTTLETAQIHLTPQTTFWKAWICFNATHSLGAILFGLIFGYLSLAAPAFLFESRFLLALGALTLISYAILVGRTGFRTPLRGIMLALLCYTAGLISYYLKLWH